MDHPYRFLTYALWGLGGFAVLFVGGGVIGWWTPAANEQAIGEVSRWCERVSGGLLREPSNTLGNLGFVVAGLSMFVVLARDEIFRKSPTNRFIGNRPTALVYAGAVVFLGSGSMVMHGSHTFFGSWLDNLSMIIYILIPWIVNLAILGRWNDRRFFVVYGSVLITFAVGYWVFGSDLGIGLDLFGLSIALSARLDGTGGSCSSGCRRCLLETPPTHAVPTRRGTGQGSRLSWSGTRYGQPVFQIVGFATQTQSSKLTPFGMC